MIGLAMMVEKAPVVDVSPDLPNATLALWTGLALVLLFFALRPELWRRMWFTRIDPRPAGLMRILFGGVVLWTMLDLLPYARFLFTDEGLWPTDAARKAYGGHARVAWDPEHGWRSFGDLLTAIWGRFSLFHLRSDPPFVFAVFTATAASLLAMIAGVYSRLSTLVAWFLVNTIYTYSPILYTGGDTVVRNFLFLGLFAGWGEAYSVDSWRRRSRAILAGAREVPPLRRIAAWPIRLMMLQLTIIYCATGALKAGITWFDGTALYYALCLDHFYRHPAQIPFVVLLQRIGALPLGTWITKIWETFFPFALIGAALQAFERERASGSWVGAASWRRALSWGCAAGVVVVASYVAGLTASYYYDPKLGPLPIDRGTMGTMVQALVIAVPTALVGGYLWLRRRPRAHDFVLRWVLGKRVWLGIGLVMHLGIDLLMNVGTFVQVMLAVYLVWLTGEELELFWRLLGTRPLRPGEAGSPPPAGGRVRRFLAAPGRRLRYRARRPAVAILHGASAEAVRRAALLRLWDLCGRLDFVEDATNQGDLRVRTPAGAVVEGAAAGAHLCRIFPALWPLAPLTLVPGLRGLVGGGVRRLLRQR